MKKKIFIFILLLIFFLGGSSFGAFLGYLNKIKTTNIPVTNNDLGINQDSLDRIKQEELDNQLSNGDITNIALFGLDAREKNEASRSDSIIILTIDKANKKIKLSSIMRDTYVNIYGHGKTKINAAYAYGGPSLAIKTLNSTFALNIKDYITVDFFSLEKVIDLLGGIDVNIKKTEIPFINECIDEVSNLENEPKNYVKNSGTQTLTGLQAVAYCRIRHVGDGDYERTLRQREVLSAIFNKVQSGGALKYPYYASKILPLIETNMSKPDILKIGTNVYANNIKTLETQRFPLDKSSKGKMIKGTWYLVTNIEETKNAIHKYLYQDIKP